MKVSLINDGTNYNNYGKIKKQRLIPANIKIILAYFLYKIKLKKI